MTEVIMTKMGDAMEEGTLLRWLKKEGDAVKAGEPLAEIQTDKANVELEAPANGILSGISLAEGDTAPIGNIIAYILAAGEKAPQQAAQQTNATQTPVETVQKGRAKTKKLEPVESSERIIASPLAKRLAREANIDLSSVKGSGPGGRIIEKDLRDLLVNPSTPHHIPTTAYHPYGPPPGMNPPENAGEPVELSRMRKLIAQRTLFSHQTIPSFYVTTLADMENLMALREQMNADDALPKLSVNDFIVKACALALVKHPHVNMMFHDETLVPLPNVNIGIMAALPEGLVVPVIKECENKTLREISEETKRLVEKARAGALSPDEMSGSTFGLSNLGMYDVDEFTAIINPPNAAILAVGSARKQVVVNADGSFSARSLMKMTLTSDHRVLDGASSAMFLKDLKALLENPVRLLS